MPETLPDELPALIRTDDDARQVYSEAAGIGRCIPRGVAVVHSASDVAALCAWANQAGVPLTPRGSGSSMAGGAIGSGVVVDLSRLRGAVLVDASRGLAHAAAGVTCAGINHAAGLEGLRFPVDPSSAEFATIGGMIATNAAGSHTMRFGATRPWVHALDCVFADGTQARLERGLEPAHAHGVLAVCLRARNAWQTTASRLTPRGTRKDSSGYGVHDFARSGELIDLLVGSEGTLAFVTSCDLALAPLPTATATVLSAWSDLTAAVHGAALAREAGAVACELLDATFLEIAARGGALSVPSTAQCVLLTEFELESTDAARDRADTFARALSRCGATFLRSACDPAAERALWTLRHAASPILSRLDPNIRSMQIVEDGCVPPARLPDYVMGVRLALDAVRVPGVIFGHAGDAHLHVNALVDVREHDWRARVRELFSRVTDLIVALGGTPSGEHGDGRLRSPILARFWDPDAMRLFADIKRTFDPSGILNPGVKSGIGTDPFAEIKYDPERTLSSGAARRVLDEVESTRRYARTRLEML